jgi:hypothetical protein
MQTASLSLMQPRPLQSPIAYDQVRGRAEDFAVLIKCGLRAGQLFGEIEQLDQTCRTCFGKNLYSFLC